MAKVDITKIEGYEGMTPEEKIKALEAYEIEDVQPDYSGYVKKDVFDKTASELAGVKKQLKEKMTDDEAAKQKEQEEREELQSKYEKLLHDSEVSKNKAKLLARGYEEKLADDTAEAMVTGDLENSYFGIAVVAKVHYEFKKKMGVDQLQILNTDNSLNQLHYQGTREI